MGWLTKAADGLKALTGKVRFPGRAFVFFDLNRPESRDIERKVGDGTSSDVLMTPVRWLQRAVDEAPWVELDDDDEPVESSRLVDLLEKPNPFYAGDVLLAGTVLSLSTAGNAYWIVALNGDGKPVELWYAPHMNMRPSWPEDDATKFITHYEYKVKAKEQKLAPLGLDPKDTDPRVEEGLAVIHFREGVDPDNLRLGLSPLKGLLREIWTDNEAAAFTASLLHNNGIPGVIVSPADKDATITPEEGKAAEDRIDTKFRGEGRGRPLVMLGPTKVEQFGFSPKELDLSPLRDVSEERVCAALGVAAAVVGFGAGLQQTKVGATMHELRQLSWTNGVLPLQRLIANTVTGSLAPALGAAKAGFDNSDVEALAENQDMRATRIERLVRAAILTRGEARVELGFEESPGDDVYLMSLATLEVPQGQRQADALAGSPGVPATLRGLGEQRSAKAHSPTEERIIAAAPTAKPPPVLARMARRLDTIRRSAAAILEDPIARVFEELGERVLAAARAADLDAGAAEGEASDADAEVKQGELGPIDLTLAEEILSAADIPAAQAALQQAFEEGFLAVSSQTSEALGDTMGVAFELDDAAQRNVMRQGGLRAGLVDLDAQTREAMFEALAEGRAEGLTADNLARRIRDRVSAGPWRDAATRARVIARTEGANAANTSTLEAARSMPETEHVMVFDDRIGFGDEDCVAANGSVITIEEAETIGLAHPNCSRSFAPVNAVLMEEMGL